MEIVKMLSAGARPSKTGPNPTGISGYNLSIKRSSTPQKNCKIVKETVLQTQAIERPTCPEMLKPKRCVSKPYGELPHEQRRRENDGKLVQQSTSEYHPKTSIMSKSTKDDELVRFMSNVPGYLQRVEKKEDMQGKALNVGVLDWGRLESYKCNQKGISVGIGSNATLSSSNLSTKITIRPAVLHSPTGIETPYGNKQHLSSSSRNNSCRSSDIFRNAKLSSQDAMPFHDVENGPSCMFDEHKKAARKYRSSLTNGSGTTLAKSKMRELDNKLSSIVDHQPSKTKSKRVPRRLNESTSSYDREAKQTVDDLQGLDVERKPQKQIVSPNMGTSKLEPSNSSSSIIREKKNVDISRTKNQIESQETAVDPPPQHQADKNGNIVLLLPRSDNSFLKQPRMLLDENVTRTKQNFVSDAFSSELDDEISHSCPLPSRAENGIENMASSAVNTIMNNSTSEVLDETLKTLNQEASATRKGRHPSPNRRFSFSSLSRMTRSFSFKENSALPQLSSSYVSVKSGPVISTSSAGLENSNRERESGHARARSSPLRRILDPLLPKLKGKTLSSLDGTDQQVLGIHSSSFRPVMVAQSPEYEKPEASSIQAQLVLTTSNGLPLFRFVTNSSIIIAAPLKNALGPGKNDPRCNYLLYAIDEIKKKSGSWINQAIKEKTCFVYNVVGEMKLNSSSSLDVVKESVLFGVEPKLTGQALLKGKPNTELAAVVMKNPSGILGFDLEHNDKEDANSCTVILPGGVHSMPKTGVPSSLIHRWKSGGSCDCGGWDIGCQLRVLSNENRQPKLTRTFSSFLKSDCLELFVQGETEQGKPIFSMVPIEKGKYSVEFRCSISLIQAFFIGVSVITSQRSSDLTEDSNVLEEKTGYGSTVWKEAPRRYTPTPPLSPVGRV